QSHMAHVRRHAEAYDALDLWYQTIACDSHDVSAQFGGDLTAALERYRSPVLVIPSASDILVPPRNAELMARLLPNADLVEIPSSAGHAAGVLETSFVSGAIRDFLSQHAL